MTRVRSLLTTLEGLFDRDLGWLCLVGILLKVGLVGLGRLDLPGTSKVFLIKVGVVGAEEDRGWSLNPSSCLLTKDWGGVGALVGNRTADPPSQVGEGGGGLSIDRPTGPLGLGLRDLLICLRRGLRGGLPSSCLGYLESHLEALMEFDLLIGVPSGLVVSLSTDGDPSPSSTIRMGIVTVVEQCCKSIDIMVSSAELITDT